jgi:hypothetical protein
MAFIKESLFGVIKVEGKKVKLYSMATSHIIINVSSSIKDARWVGKELIIYLDDGQIRKYKSPISYSTIN